MKTLVLIALLAAVFGSGCTTKARARADARAAFYQGQARAMAGELGGRVPPPAPPNTVNILGPVSVNALQWTHGLTLGQTIVAAEYIPAGEPAKIIIYRSGQVIPVSAAQLLEGHDVPILPRDVVELQP
jgi:ABC-type Fe3+-hydroxamate transport system substrate-binding protein